MQATSGSVHASTRSQDNAPTQPDWLAKNVRIIGQRQTYEIDTPLFTRGLGRLYSAFAMPGRSPVIVKEYVLAKHTFNQKEAYERKQHFHNLAGLSLADGRRQDMRLLRPDDIIVDERANRCYIITDGKPTAFPCLRTYLTAAGSLPGALVVQVLLQVLQTLICLHEQKFCLPNGQIQTALAHGNLNLDTLLIQTRSALESPLPPEGATYVDKDFLIYLCDPALWEFIFQSPAIRPVPTSIADDLKQIGIIGMALLRGEPNHPAELSPDLLNPLERFLARLQGIENRFTTAAEARKVLLSLETLDDIEQLPFLPSATKQTSAKPLKAWLIPLLIAAGCCTLLAALIWLGLYLRGKRVSPTRSAQPLCCVDQVPGISQGDFSYASHELGPWHYTQMQKRQVGDIEQKFSTLLQARQPELSLEYAPVLSVEKARQQMLGGKYDFVITDLAQPSPPEVTAHPFAYDGLAVFVAFAYAERDKSLPRSLKGKITFDQLRQLYTGEISNWQQLGGPNLPVRLYLPADPVSIRIFEESVLRDDNAIRDFRQKKLTMETLPSLKLLRQVLQDFETRNVGAISFAPWSQVYGQCSVYPLALKQKGQRAIQALVDEKGRAITPETNLCAAKGSYFQSEELFREARYPLSYPLGIMYPKNNKQSADGQTFTQILKTLEVQHYLKQSSLVPLYPLPPQSEIEEAIGRAWN